MKIVGLVGETGTGKSTVAAHLVAHGAGHIDADRIVHELLDNDREIQKKIGERFGPETVVNHRVDRGTLGGIVFNDRDALADLNRIVHPAVIDECVKRIRHFAHSGVDLVVIDAALLLEVPLPFAIDLMIALRCGRKEQIRRLLAKGVPAAEVNARIESQSHLQKSFGRADVVVDTERPKEQVLAEIAKMVDFLLDRGRS